MSNRFLQAITGLFKPRGAVSEAARPSVVAEASTAPTSGRRVITEDEHSIPRKYLDDNAAKVVYRLTDQGYEAYLVGGCIRDLLLKKRPKDFDVATSAHPEEAHELFKRSRLIGRRLSCYMSALVATLLKLLPFVQAMTAPMMTRMRFRANRLTPD